jgi:hypothetical protein
VAIALVAMCAIGPRAQAAESVLGDQAGAWPGFWQPYLLANAHLVLDPIGDVGCGPGYCDVSSGGSGNLSSVYWATDGSNLFVRLRVEGDPSNPAAGGFRSTAYVVAIGVGGVQVAAMGLDAKPANRDFVYVANADGSAYTEIYAFPFDASGGQLSAAARALPDGSGHYFVDWQVPIARITQRTSGAVTATTPIQLFFGTSQSANLSVINKDYMIGNSVDFGSSSTIVIVPPPPPAAPAPPVAPNPGTPATPPSGGTPPSSGPPPGGGTPPTRLPNTAMP